MHIALEAGYLSFLGLARLTLRLRRNPGGSIAVRRSKYITRLRQSHSPHHQSLHLFLI